MVNSVRVMSVKTMLVSLMRVSLATFVSVVIALNAKKVMKLVVVIVSIILLVQSHHRC